MLLLFDLWDEDDPSKTPEDGFRAVLRQEQYLFNSLSPLFELECTMWGMVECCLEQRLAFAGYKGYPPNLARCFLNSLRVLLQSVFNQIPRSWRLEHCRQEGGAQHLGSAVAPAPTAIPRAKDSSSERFLPDAVFHS